MQTTFVRAAQENPAGPVTHAPARTTTQNLLKPKESLFKSRTAGNGNGDKSLVAALSTSKIFQEYERAFTEATGLPVALRPVESWQLPHHGKRNEGPFCALMSEKSRACAACLQVQEKLSQTATHEPCTATCSLGLSDTAVPVRLGDRLIAFCKRGRYFAKNRPKPNSSAPTDCWPSGVSRWTRKSSRMPISRRMSFPTSSTLPLSNSSPFLPNTCQC